VLRDAGRPLAAAALSLCLVAPLRAAADTAPLWEFGLGPGVVLYNNYPGSAITHVYPVPVPYLLYRGTFLRSDRDGVRGILLEQPALTIDFSAAGSVPVNSRDDPARAGMPNLSATAEIGPSFDWHVWRSADQQIRIDLRAPIRAAFTVNSSPQSIGWYASPNINVDMLNVAGQTGWNLGLLAGPLFASRSYDQYFYSVAPQFATSERPAYSAAGGYSGAEVTAALSKRYPKFWIGAYARYESLAHAAFANSPLVQRDGDFSAGIGFAWIIGRSSRMVGTERAPVEP
jgi:MipA family protein